MTTRSDYDFPSLLRERFVCDLGSGDHGHTDCWIASGAADLIDAIDAWANENDRDVLSAVLWDESHADAYLLAQSHVRRILAGEWPPKKELKLDANHDDGFDVWGDT